MEDQSTERDCDIRRMGIGGGNLSQTFNRSKYDGLVDSLTGPCLLDQIYGLGKPTYERWLNRFTKKKTDRVVSARAASMSQPAPMLAIVDAARVPLPDPGGGALGGVADGDDDGDRKNCDDGAQPAEGKTPEENEKHRSTGNALYTW